MGKKRKGDLEDVKGVLDKLMPHLETKQKLGAVHDSVTDDQIDIREDSDDGMRLTTIKIKEKPKGGETHGQYLQER